MIYIRINTDPSEASREVLDEEKQNEKSILWVVAILFFLLGGISLEAAEPRVFLVGAFNYYPGIFKDTDGVVKGFYVDALADIGQRENIRFEYIFGSWAEGLERIQSGEVDVLTSVAFTEERAGFLDHHGVLDEGVCFILLSAPLN
jgi:ABC-type amino acid transport substrate-binding protein